MTIILNETIDVKTTSVLLKNGAICKRFLGFTNVSVDQTALDISLIDFNLVDDFYIGSKLVAQTYDGASVMSVN